MRQVFYGFYVEFFVRGLVCGDYCAGEFRGGFFAGYFACFIVREKCAGTNVRGLFQKIWAFLFGIGKRLLAAPFFNKLMVALQEHIGHSHALKDSWT